MSFKKDYPDFAAVEQYIRQARAERAAYIATGLANLVAAALGGVKRFASNAPVARPVAPAIPRAAARG